jgi:hypothetical protein
MEGIGQIGEASCDMTVGTRQLGKVGWDRTVLQNSWNFTTRRIMEKPEQGSKYMAAGIGQPGQGNCDGTAMTGQPGQNIWDRTIEKGQSG